MILLHREIIPPHFTNYLYSILFRVYSSQPPSHYYMFQTDSGSSMEQQAALLLQDCKAHWGPRTYFMPCTYKFCFSILAQAGWITGSHYFCFFTTSFNIKNRISHCTLSWGSILPSLLEWRRKANKTRCSCSFLPARLELLEILLVHYTEVIIGSTT